MANEANLCPSKMVWLTHMYRQVCRVCSLTPTHQSCIAASLAAAWFATTRSRLDRIRSATRAANFYAASGLELEEFLDLVQAARVRTKRYTASIRTERNEQSVKPKMSSCLVFWKTC